MKEELLRIWDVVQEEEKVSSNLLRHYCLTLYAGEAMVVTAKAGEGLRGLLDLLTGKCPAISGKIFIREQEVPLQRNHLDLWNQIYVNTQGRNLVENLTVAENLELMTRGRKLLSFYPTASINKRTARYLAEDGLDYIRPDEKVWKLSFLDRQKLSLVQAHMQHARVFVMDCTKMRLSGKEIHAMMPLIQKYRQDGMAFLFLAYQVEGIQNLDVRVQTLAHGHDKMEWESGARLPEYLVSLASLEENRRFEGIFSEVAHSKTFPVSLYQVYASHRSYWDETIQIELPQRWGQIAGKKTVLIPMDSGMRLLENLSLRDNLIMNLSGRIARDRFGYISDRLAENVVQRFYQDTGIHPDVKTIAGLTPVERKILSIHRWVLTRPECLILQEPAYGMDFSESLLLHQYLESLPDKGIRLVIVSEDRGRLEKYCSKIYHLMSK